MYFFRKQIQVKEQKQLKGDVKNWAQTNSWCCLQLKLKLMPMDRSKRDACINGLKSAELNDKDKLKCLQIAEELCRTDKQYERIYSAMKFCYQNMKYYWCNVAANYRSDGKAKKAENAEKKEKEAGEKESHYKDLYEQKRDKRCLVINEKTPLIERVRKTFDI